MPIENALVAFGKWVAFFDKDTGSVTWAWFGDPIQESLKGMQSGERRKFLAEIFREIVTMAGMQASGQSPVDGNGRTFSTGYKWEPFDINGVAQVGITWNDETANKLELGLGGQVAIPAADQQVKLGVLAQLLKIENQNVDPLFGNVKFSGGFPVPDFLTSGSLNGEIKPSPFSVQLGLGAVRPAINGAINEREFTWNSAAPVDGALIAWDAARIAMFVIEAWVKSKATPNGTDFFSRADEHFFPMFGEPPNATIGTFPLFQPQGDDADFKPWTNSVLKLDGGAGGAMTFLWHLRALITGKEDTRFLGGSVYFPLHGNPIEGAVPNINNPSGQWPQDATQPGAWIGIKDITDGFQLVVVLKADNKVAELPLGQVTNLGPNPNISLPPQSSVLPALTAMATAAVNQALPDPIEITNNPNDVTITLFKEDVPADPIFPGSYQGKIRIAKNNGAVTFIGQLPAGEIQLPPPTDPRQIVGMVVDWVIRGAGNAAGEPAKGILTAMAAFIKTATQQGTVQPPQVLALIGAVADALGDTATIKVDPLTIKFGSKIRGELEFRNLKFTEIPNVEVAVGQATAHVEVELATGDITDVKFGLSDVRLASPAGANNKGLVATLLPDLTKAPGFTIALKGPPNALLPEGGGKIPIQKTIGPLDLTSLLVYISAKELMLGIDLSFTLGPILVSVFELGVAVNFTTGAVAPFLHGLAISLDADVVRLQGFFGEVTKGAGVPSDYVGGAVVSVVDMFELTAIGGYSQTQSGDASLFIFASLVAPLGGPPYLFITGIAGGFGFNRKLPPPGLLYEHPFLQVMAGKIDMSQGTEKLLEDLSAWFAVTQDTYWLAGGIQFISFGFIYGKLVVAIQFGHSFAISILGMAAFGIAPVAYFEIAIEVSADEEKFILKAGVSPNSYIIHPDVFSLRGDFGLGVWYDGDFVFSIGGFHPYYNVPERYQALNLQPVTVKAVIWGWVRVSVECFFACTPQALMAGCSVSLAADFEGIAAGLDVYVDVLITWDPFYIWARMGVTVWFEFMGRHEISVELQIWTPPFGGIATIDLALVSFDISFGADQKEPPPPKLAEFLTKQVGVPASGGHEASVQRFNTDDVAGLFHIEVTQGSISKDKTLAKSSKQKGISSAIPVTPEFVYVIQTRLPWLTMTGAAVIDKFTFGGQTDLALCRKMNLGSSFSVSAKKLTEAKRTLLSDFFPAAEFGELLATAQANTVGGQSAIGSLKTDEPSVVLNDGLEARYDPVIEPKALLEKPLDGEFYEPPDPDEVYPLPFHWTGNVAQTFRTARSNLLISKAVQGVNMTARPATVPRRIAAAAAFSGRKAKPLTISSRVGSFERTMIPPRLRGQTLATVPTGVPVMAPPPSPLRSSEMYAVTLRITEPHTPTPIRRRPLGPTIGPVAISRLRIRPEALKKIRPGALSPAQTTQPAATTNNNVLNLSAGGAGELLISAEHLNRVFVTNAGTQITRAICLTSADEPVADMYIAPAGNAALPTRTRRIVCIGEGTDAPVAVGPTPRPEENVGIEANSTLLALSPREFAGKGCVVQLDTNLSFTPERFDSIAGFEILRSASSLRVFFPAVVATALAGPAVSAWSLVIVVEATVAEPADAVERVRWIANGATLANLHTIIDAGRVAFIMQPQAGNFWSIDVDISSEWRLAGVTLCNRQPRDLATRFRSDPDWDCVDDRFEEQKDTTKSTVTLEVAQ